MNRKLILFDIDGVLIKAHVVAYDYWRDLLKKHYGIDVGRSDIYTEGKTDKEVLKDLLEYKGVKNPLSDEKFTVVLGDVGNEFQKAIGERKIEPNFNVERLLTSLTQQGHILGVLTGNTREKAAIKLRRSGLEKYFKVGAFGDASVKRSDLVMMAARDVKQKLGIEFPKKDIYIIGDTVRDIRCAKEAGVKSLAVAMGVESIETLKKEKPDHLVKDFSDLENILIILNENTSD
ncbi:HAD family hydrolase [[Eubacterium] cellulosolvens]